MATLLLQESCSRFEYTHLRIGIGGKFMALRCIVALIFAAAASVFAADFWEVKDPALWSEAQIRKIVTDSPWAKEAAVSFKGNAKLPVGARGGLAGRSAAGVADPARGDRASNAAGAGPEIFTDTSSTPPPVVVRWEAARPVCEACARGGMDRYLFSCTSKILYLSDLERKFDELARAFYILSMSNYPNPGQRGDPPQPSSAAAAVLERMSSRIQQSAFLRRAGKIPIEASKVVILPAGRTLLVILFFPRSEPITLADKEVVFDSEGETLVVKSRFNLARMVYKGRLDL